MSGCCPVRRLLLMLLLLPPLLHLPLLQHPSPPLHWVGRAHTHLHLPQLQLLLCLCLLHLRGQRQPASRLLLLLPGLLLGGQKHGVALGPCATTPPTAKRRCCC